jgi:TatA/E family protein of Tat protein translocase
VPFEGAFSPVHWLIIAVVALVVLGPERFPDAARKVGRAWREFQDAGSSIADHQLHPTADPGPTDSDTDDPDQSEGMSDIARQVGGVVRELQRVQQHLRAELDDVVSEFDARSSGQEVPGSDRVPVLPPKPDSAGAETTTETARPVESA